MPKKTETVDAVIEAPAAVADTRPRWATWTDGTAHIVNKAGTPRCGHKRGKPDVVIGTIPADRRPPCEKCVS